MSTDSETKTAIPEGAKAASEAAVKAAIEETLEADQSHEEGEVEEGEKGKNGNVTVFNDAANFNVVHPLYSKWVLWFDNASKQTKAKDWNDQLQEVMEIESVEEFWGLYNNIIAPSHIAPNSNYYLFKKGVKPAWEDPANSLGGKWAVQLPRDKSRDSIDKTWLYTMLAAIGETFEMPYPATTPLPDVPYNDQVTGVIVSSRKAFYRISIWTRTSESREKVDSIGKHFKYDVLGVPEGKKMGGASGKGADIGSLASDVEFISHKDSQVRGKKPTFVA